MLSDRERDELLIRLDERIDRMRKDQKDLKTAMESDEGFARCQLHQQKVISVEDSIKWTKRSAFGALIALIVKMVYEWIAPTISG